ncbi:hypothetical protein [Brevibacillus dissolubilis]|uniref:hypothetical protein n=1 Tax=Brevibacillus dissolubilis TaxID=1844116 RepID=UPI0021003F86|nr:hypothetical protein [Brevibacillus dissolubilis]
MTMMIHGRAILHRFIADEQGTILPAALFFWICMAGFVSLLLLIEQADLTEMKTQQTADLIVRGARYAGEGVYVTKSGEEKRRLFATTEEGQHYKAELIRGAREEAEILLRYNQAGLLSTVDSMRIDHQKGEQGSLYYQGIYHVAVEVKKQTDLFGRNTELKFRRTAQAEIEH